ncbi:MAG: PilZ domain-containing protein [Chrysiogenetes bacterium]|nr:PilZ domain-containing protein [Chrysiogenetes bacterium]
MTTSDSQPAPYAVERKHPRIPLTIEIRCKGSGRSERFISRDLSPGGVFLYTTRVYPIDATVDLSFYVPYHHEQITVRGRVARHSQDTVSGIVDGMGIEFTEVPEDARESIDHYMQTTRK